jgi:hypothetical protein
MGSRRKHTLPLLDTAGPRTEAGPPHLESARRSLGGRASTSATAGALVALRADSAHPGVVLYASETEVDVWLGDGRVRRTRPDRVDPYRGPAPAALLPVAADARVYAALAEGQRVVYQDERGDAAEGLLVEKCRYGALVARDDGTMLAVGFRRLLPAPRAAHEPS